MRNNFPLFRKHPRLIYLDSAATAQKPDCVVDAMHRAYSEEYGTVHRAIYHNARTMTEKYNASREAACRFLGARLPEEIVFTRGTTDAINLVAQSYGKTFLKPGDEILISEMEHHSNIVPWQLVAAQTGAILRWIPVDAKGILLWEGMISERTKIVSLAHMSNVTGTINPIALIASEAKKVGAILVVDGAQGAPHLKVDVSALGCDFYAFSGHKCYGPTGVGVLYGRLELLEKMPPIEGGGDMIEEVFLEKSTYQKPPLRFEAGTPSIVPVIALKSALEFIEAHRGKEEALLSYATRELQKIEGLHIVGEAPQKGPIITFHIEGVHPLDLATLLDLEQIAIRSGHLCAQPLLRKFGLEVAARCSFGLYNTKSDVDAFVGALSAIVPRLFLVSILPSGLIK